jgi:hypothetical protein
MPFSPLIRRQRWCAAPVCRGSITRVRSGGKCGQYAQHAAPLMSAAVATPYAMPL